MTENESELFKDADEPDIEFPDDGSGTRPPEEGSSDYPDTLEEHDPLREDPVVVQESDGPTTVAGSAPEPADEETVPIEETDVLDEDELDDSE
jgi:hypothetical protein